ncbi:hypothetical protein JCM10908_000958 [Rhodotorula pacifica]|uniref:uncharacterized protein n=1 Tax=Rhodotorula pacifica TaxID=1495444 RepID=UPI003181C63A
MTTSKDSASPSTPSAAPTAAAAPQLATSSETPSVCETASQLDATSWQHLERLTLQLLKCTKLDANIWQGRLSAVLRSIESTLSQSLLERLARSRTAEAQARSSLRERQTLLNAAFTHDSSLRTKDEFRCQDTTDAYEERRTLWRAAALHLSEVAAPVEKGHRRSGTLEEWTHIDELPKIAVLDLRIRIRELNGNTVRTEADVRAASFEVGIWTGDPLFGHGLPVEEADLCLVDRAGGTIEVVATAKEATHLPRILEFLVFALLSASLELHLLHTVGHERQRTLEATSRDQQDVATSLAASENIEAGATGPDHLVERERSSRQSSPTVSTTSNLPEQSRSRRLRGSWLDLLAPKTSTQGGTSSSVVHDSSPPVSRARGFRRRFKDLSASIRSRHGKTLSAGDFLSFVSANLGHAASQDRVLSEEPPSRPPELDESSHNQPKMAEPARRPFDAVVESLASFALSTSPHVTYPPPHLLTRLRQDELDADTDSPVSGAHAVALDLASKSHTSSSLTRPDVPRIGLDAKTGLSSLTTGNTSLAGCIRHQSIEVLLQITAGTEARPCLPPRSTSLTFYGGSQGDMDGVSDMTLHAFLSELEGGQNSSCEACNRPWSVHTLSILHAEHRLDITISDVAPLEHDQPGDIWRLASSCGCEGPDADGAPRDLCPVAGALSMSKLLEWLWYSDAARTLCQHSDTRAVPTYHFHRGNRRATFEITPVRLFDLRLPTAVDSSALSQTGKVPARMKQGKHQGNEAKGQLRSEIDCFFATTRLGTDDETRAAIDMDDELCSAALEGAEPDRLNAVRHAFKATAARYGWTESAAQPAYFANDVHAFPVGSSILVRDSEISSLIALALSSSEFADELKNGPDGAIDPSSPADVDHPISPRASLSRSTYLPIPEAFRQPQSAASSLASSVSSVFRAADIEVVEQADERPSFQVSTKRRKDHAVPSGSVFRHIIRQRSGEGQSWLRPQEPDTTSATSMLPSSTALLNELIVGTPSSTMRGKTARRIPSVIAGLSTRKDDAGLLSATEVYATAEKSPRLGTATPTAEAAARSAAARTTANVVEQDDESDLSDLFSTSHRSSPEKATLASELLSASIRRGLSSLRPVSSALSLAFAGQRQGDLDATVTEHVKLKMREGGATFLRTHDDRFILKELTSHLGFSELESLLVFAPKLLDYLEHPERPSLLAKIFGIYTVKCTDATTGYRFKQHLVVLENIFHGRGIATRTTKSVTEGENVAQSTTGWDGDWLLQSQLLIRPHSKALLREALANDVKFLSEQGNIDFSLLCGVDDSRGELIVGLIDILGVYNALKLLEHQAKTAVKLATAADASTVTVLPPQDYAKRFLAVMERYFVAVPDKWTRPPGQPQQDPDPRLWSPL